MKSYPQACPYYELSYTVVKPGNEPPKPTLKVVTWNNVVSESINPRWRAEIVAKREAGTSHTASWKKLEITPYSGASTSKSTQKTELFAYAPPARAYPSAVSESLRAEADAKCIGKFRTKVQSLVMELSGPTFLGELRSTISMIKSPARALFQSMLRYLRWCNRESKSFRKKRRKNLKDLESRINNKYLEYTFGWVPLMSDIEGGIKALANFNKTKSDYATAVQSVDLPAATAVETSTLTNFRLTSRTQATASYTVKCYGKIRASLIGAAGSYERMKASFGFSWREFIPTVWNLLPFSFVVDYFTNLNELLLSDYSSTATLVYSGMVKVTKSSVSDTTKVSRHGSAVLSMWIGSSGSRYQEAGTYSRSIGIDALIPTVGLPGIRQAFNIASLIKALRPH